jgi:hypothetical protein
MFYLIRREVKLRLHLRDPTRSYKPDGFEDLCIQALQGIHDVTITAIKG